MAALLPREEFWRRPRRRFLLNGHSTTRRYLVSQTSRTVRRSVRRSIALMELAALGGLFTALRSSPDWVTLDAFVALPPSGTTSDCIREMTGSPLAYCTWQRADNRDQQTAMIDARDTVSFALSRNWQLRDSLALKRTFDSVATVISRRGARVLTCAALLRPSPENPFVARFGMHGYNLDLIALRPIGWATAHARAVSTWDLSLRAGSLAPACGPPSRGLLASIQDIYDAVEQRLLRWHSPRAPLFMISRHAS